MAHVDRIWLQRAEDKAMRVYVALKPAGEVCLYVDLPDDFRDAILKIAQAAADKHEQEMRMQILADNTA